MQDGQQASAQYRRAIDFDRKALEASPDAVRAKRGLAILRMKLGDIIRDADPETALSEFEGAIQLFKELPSAELEKPATARTLLFLERKRADALRDLQEWSSAADALQPVVSQLNKIYEADPTDKRAAFDLLVGLGDLRELYYFQRDSAKALQPAERASQITRDLSRQDPGNRTLQLDAAYTQFYLATILAWRGNNARAVPLAREAMKWAAQLAARPDAAPRDLDLATQVFTEVEPAELRDPHLAVSLARRFLSANGPGDVIAGYRLAKALQVAGQLSESKIVAQRTLALMAPVKKGRIPYRRKVLEELTLPRL
jgi:tetratricopeptide (TPR) repeat protein